LQNNLRYLKRFGKLRNGKLPIASPRRLENAFCNILISLQSAADARNEITSIGVKCTIRSRNVSISEVSEAAAAQSI
jgi:hypothetical protein